MNEAPLLALAWLSGLILGAIFFGGLWWTIRKGISSKQPALWFLGSKLLRMGVTLGGFYLVGGGRWERWLLCLLGFVLVRLITWRLTGPPARRRTGPAPEASYAP